VAVSTFVFESFPAKFVNKQSFINLVHINVPLTFSLFFFFGIFILRFLMQHEVPRHVKGASTQEMARHAKTKEIRNNANSPKKLGRVSSFFF
jgi:hypothetical protein